MTASGRHCFTYGSLMVPEIMAAVCGLKVQAVTAQLPGYSRHPVRGEEYPGMVPNANATVDGMLYLDLPPDALARLDTFEGEQYTRSTVIVLDARQRSIEADTYIFRPKYADLLLPGDWDYAAFLREGRQRFEQRYMGYQRI